MDKKIINQKGGRILHAQHTMAKKTGAKPKYKTPLMGVFVRVANDKDKKVIRKTEKELLTKHLIKND